MKKNHWTTLIFAALLAASLPMTLSGCVRRGVVSETVRPAESTVQADPHGPADDPAEAEVRAERQNGERFEGVVVIEGMEETVRYEHVRNDSVGFEMDYDYEKFERLGGADRECFVSRYDDAGSPENYLEVRYSPLDAGAAAAAVSEALSHDYDINREDSFRLDRAGSCIRIDASAEKGGLTMPERLQMVYIIPASDGCRIATAHYFIEGAEGFGRRFHSFMDSFTVAESQGEKRLSEEQALAAAKRYIHLNDPDLDSIASAGEHGAYWDVSSSEGSPIVVLFRSYTGALTRFYMDPVSGDTYVTEFVPGITPEEVRKDEGINAWKYLF